MEQAAYSDMDRLKNFLEKLTIFNQEREWDQFHSPENLAKSISIEAAELLECFQWDDDYEYDDVKDELADVMNYCLLMAQALDIDIVQALEEKLEKTIAKYPVDKSRGRSTKYNKL